MESDCTMRLGLSLSIKKHVIHEAVKLAFEILFKIFWGQAMFLAKIFGNRWRRVLVFFNTLITERASETWPTQTRKPNVLFFVAYYRLQLKKAKSWMLNKSFPTHWLQLELKTKRSKNIDFAVDVHDSETFVLKLSKFLLPDKISGKVLHFLPVWKMRVGPKKPR